ncbi:TonB-dependent receptor [Danxiaibacter flavus]|uniref:TonB-dependent receptor n=1 Tax=Danxiaibacter flavus TaxID=3049108 RepID=A0ABV3ZN02_9BACT|nr:TonB-dependent receptor [Chitinophagaceae bacterium DXS]
MKIRHVMRACILSMLFSIVCFAAFSQKKITGTVTSSKTKQPVASASVTVKGANVGTATDNGGNFTITVPAGKTVLTISSVGFADQDVTIGDSPLSVLLQESTSSLNEIVVTGYTGQKKKDLTGAVAVVDVAGVKAQPAASPIEGLQGKATGVQITSDGAAGSTPQIRIRGFSTINDNDPLYIIDGMPYRGKLGWLNANDIESMQVLKDASAASIYGSRANNGVVIITTKKGKAGTPKLSLDVYYGTQNPNKSRYPKMLNPTEYANYFYQEFINAGQTPGTSGTTGTNYGTSPTTPTLPEYLLAGTATGQNITAADSDPSKYNYSTDASTFYQITKANQQGTDWMRAITTNAPIQNYELGLTGGGDNSQYALSGSYFDQQGTLKYTSYKRATIRANSNFFLFNKRLTIGENMQYSYNRGVGYATNTNTAGSYQSEGAAVFEVYRMQSIIPVYDIMGNFAGTKGSILGNGENPLSLLYRARNNVNTDNQFFGSAFADLKIIDGLNLRSTYGVRYDNYTGISITVPNPEMSEGSVDRNSMSEWQGNSSDWTWTNTLTFRRTFNDHSLSVLAGTEAVNSNYRQVTGNGNNFFLYGDMNYYYLSAAATTSSTSAATKSTLFSLFGRVDYSFKDKYLLSGTVRRDGSSNFGPQNRYGVFPAASAAWRVSKENFMQGVNWLNDLKVRAGWGITGNQNIPAFQYLKTFQSSLTASSYPTGGSSTSAGIWVNSYDNPAIKWEQVEGLNIGVDFSILKNKIEGSFDWYNKDTKDMLYPVPLPSAAVGGGASPYVNIGKMNNKGVELMLTYHYDGDPRPNSFRFDVTGAISHNVNKIVELTPTIDYVPYNSVRDITTSVLKTGAPFGAFYGYKMTGIYQSADDIAKRPSYDKARVGGPIYEDVSGPDGKPDGKIDANDRTVIGTPHPKYIYSLSYNASYKHFDILLFFNGSQGNQIFEQTRYYTDLNGFDGAVTKRMLNAWSPTNTGSMIPSPYRGRSTTELQSSSYYIQNGSFLKLKNLQIGYDLSSAIKNKGISKLRLYVAATNLFTITKYTGLDPEVSSVSSTYSAPGVDYGIVPMSRQFLFGINATF